MTQKVFNSQSFKTIAIESDSSNNKQKSGEFACLLEKLPQHNGAFRTSANNDKKSKGFLSNEHSYHNLSPSINNQVLHSKTSLEHMLNSGQQNVDSLSGRANSQNNKCEKDFNHSLEHRNKQSFEKSSTGTINTDTAKTQPTNGSMNVSNSDQSKKFQSDNGLKNDLIDNKSADNSDANDKSGVTEKLIVDINLTQLDDVQPNENAGKTDLEAPALGDELLGLIDSVDLSRNARETLEEKHEIQSSDLEDNPFILQRNKISSALLSLVNDGSDEKVDSRENNIEDGEETDNDDAFLLGTQINTGVPYTLDENPDVQVILSPGISTLNMDNNTEDLDMETKIKGDNNNFEIVASSYNIETNEDKEIRLEKSFGFNNQQDQMDPNVVLAETEISVSGETSKLKPQHSSQLFDVDSKNNIENSAHNASLSQASSDFNSSDFNSNGKGFADNQGSDRSSEFAKQTVDLNTNSFGKTEGLRTPHGLDNTKQSNTLEQVRVYVVEAIKTGQKNLVVKLTPEHLGEITIKTSVENGILKVEIRVQKEEAYTALMKEVSVIESAVKEVAEDGKATLEFSMSDQSKEQKDGRSAEERASEVSFSEVLTGEPIKSNSNPIAENEMIISEQRGLINITV